MSSPVQMQDRAPCLYQRGLGYEVTFLPNSLINIRFGINE